MITILVCPLFLSLFFTHLFAGHGAAVMAPAGWPEYIPELGAKGFFAKQIFGNVDPFMENDV